MRNKTMLLLLAGEVDFCVFYYIILNTITAIEISRWKMTFIPAPQAVKSVFKCTYQGEELINVLHFRWTAVTPSEEDLASHNVGLQGWWSDNLASLLTAGTVLTEITSTDVSQQNGASVATSTNVPGTKSPGPATLPGNVALCVSKRTAKRGRSFRGRFYFGGLSTASINSSGGNQADSTLTSGLLSAFEALNAVVQELSPVIVTAIVSYFFNGSPRATAVVEPIVSYVVNSAMDSQRRRLAGRGA